MTKRKDEKKNIFVISVDALRADHLGCMGYKHNVSPNIDKLADESVLFTQALAPGSYTFISFPSIMTSLYPSEYYSDSSNVFTLPGELRKHGYKTVSFNSNPHAKGKLDQGFDFFYDLLECSEFDKTSEKLK
ncbi:MAG: sulfatase-like hydrolase/transferase, partial [Petrotogales bacterium]